MIATIIIFMSISAAVWADQICLDKLGCFRSLTAFVTPLNPILIPVPEPLKRINTRFFLQTRTHRQPFEVRAANASMVLDSSFDPSKPIKFLIHGYRPGPVATWPYEMSKDILDVDDVNCFSVNWEDGAGIRYEQAVSNARVVGAQIAQFKASLQDMYEKSSLDVHIIGHSLGAHVAAFAGQTENSHVQRITALDPAGPLFEGAKNDMKLDSSDAKCVDAIYTDTPTFTSLLMLRGLGTNDVSGHLNFYANGGRNQPGCETTPLLSLLNPTDIFSAFSCSHSRSVDLYREVIRNPEAFRGHRAASYEAYLNLKVSD
ncbi:pancreatic triacylglycerol lipase-like isoform X2 [Ranitomeya variabilis]|uniref:pancreatic triacylglycerol lipase-like isoform X2 n=1 Tax=Ranitomeya variabilis TaxID=490064 RepID=UPI004056DEDB